PSGRARARRRREEGDARGDPRPGRPGNGPCTARGAAAGRRAARRPRRGLARGRPGTRSREPVAPAARPRPRPRARAPCARRERVERRPERGEKQAKSGDPKLRAEVEELRKVLAHVDAGAPLSDYPGELPAELEPLTTLPLLAVENGPGGIDLALEAELAELS